MPVNSLLEALVLTEIIELPVAYAAGLRSKIGLATLAVANLATNPLLNFVLLLIASQTGKTPGMEIIIPLECLVIIAEFGILFYVLRKDKRKLLLISLTVNAASFGIGLFL
jgi:hypothetical protein